jgi:hypothetical protein
MSHTETDVVLDQINIIKLDISLWTSAKKLRPEDLVLADGSMLPPDELAHLGNKKTIDPDLLKDFNNLKKKAERACLKTGTRFLGGFANPKSQVSRIVQELKDIQIEFEDAKKCFLDRYETETQNWMNKHPQFKDAIGSAIEPVDSVAGKLKFSFVVFRVELPSHGDDSLSAADESLTGQVADLSDQLFHEIAQDASVLLQQSFFGKQSITARCLNAFKRMRDKLNSLAFLDHRCMPVVDEIDNVLGNLPVGGPYTGREFDRLFTLVMLLSDASKIKQHGMGLLGQSTSTFTPVMDVESDAVEQLVSTVEPEQLMPEVLIDVSVNTVNTVETLPNTVLNESVENQNTVDETEDDFDAFLARRQKMQDLSVETVIRRDTPMPEPELVVTNDDVLAGRSSPKQSVDDYWF